MSAPKTQRALGLNHSNDDWYIDSGMHGIKVRVQNGGLQLGRYTPSSLMQMRDPEAVLRVFLIDMDRDWKRACKEASK